MLHLFFFFQAEDGIRDADVTGVQTCALPIFSPGEQMMYANAEQLRRAGYDEEVVRRALDLRSRFEVSVPGRPVNEEQLKADLLAGLETAPQVEGVAYDLFVVAGAPE